MAIHLRRRESIFALGGAVAARGQWAAKSGRIAFLGAEPPTLLARADEVME
jgi:hypothetical protein